MTTAAAYPWENDPESVRAAKRAVEKHLLELGPEQGKEFIGSGIRVTAEFLRVANDIGQGPLWRQPGNGPKRRPSSSSISSTQSTRSAASASSAPRLPA